MVGQMAGGVGIGPGATRVGSRVLDSLFQDADGYRACGFGEVGNGRRSGSRRGIQRRVAVGFGVKGDASEPLFGSAAEAEGGDAIQIVLREHCARFEGENENAAWRQGEGLRAGESLMAQVAATPLGSRPGTDSIAWLGQAQSFFNLDRRQPGSLCSVLVPSDHWRQQSDNQF